MINSTDPQIGDGSRVSNGVKHRMLGRTSPSSGLVWTNRRVFLGWNRPILESAVERLFQECSQAGTWDMRRLLIVLPSNLAARRLQELLALKTKQESVTCFMPRTVTIGALPEYLYVPQRPFAAEFVQQLAWAASLQSIDRSQLDQLMPNPPAEQATSAWLEFGKLLSQLHRELSSDGWDFAAVAAHLAQHAEGPRWQVLSEIQSRYLETLHNQNLWDIQTARLHALQNNEVKNNRPILILGCVDLNTIQRRFINAVSADTQFWIAAPEQIATHFESDGCLNVSAWQNFELSLPESELLVGAGPAEQVQLATACVAQLGADFHIREVTLGVPDSSLVGELQFGFSRCGVETRYGPGRQLAHSSPVRLLELLARYVNSRSYSDLSALLRHPAIPNVLRRSRVPVDGNWLALIDEYYEATLPKLVDDFINIEAPGAKQFAAITEAIHAWLKRLPNKPQRLGAWVQPLLQTLSVAFEKHVCHPDSPQDQQLFDSAALLRDAIVTLRDVPSGLDVRMSLSEVILWLKRSMLNKLVPMPESQTAIEMLGWLELAFDDAPALIIVGLHDGVVPENLGGDAFLPNQLRRSLGMTDNSSRFARDLYYMELLIHSKKFLRVVTGKTDSAGDPLVPSRVLLACPLADLPARTLHLVQDGQVDVLPKPHDLWRQFNGGQVEQRTKLPIPHPDAVRTPDRITVTAFRDYLKCPYRFYLQHILKLRDKADDEAELDARTFGNLIHDALYEFGKSEYKDSSNAEQIESFLVQQVQLIADASYGPNPPTAVSIQIEQAVQRLRNFAAKQAARAAEGWQIRYVEVGIDYDSQVLVGPVGNQLHLIGRIDRIDFHPHRKCWAIWDYKTSDNAKHPVSVHFSKLEGWKDLQLPLYLKVAAKLGITGDISLGYVSIPKQSADLGFYLADFSADQVLAAHAKADEVAFKVRNQQFWPEQIGPVDYDNFSRICQIGVQSVAASEPESTEFHFAQQTEGLPRVAKNVIEQAKQRLENPRRQNPSFEPLLIKASAGTGKTFQLSNRLLKILLAGQDVDSILATTFTRKAAGEILHRVLQRLAKACVSDSAARDLGKFVLGVDVSQANCIATLRRVTSQINRLRIGTLDSFFTLLAKAFSLEMGLPPAWSTVDPTAEPIMKMDAITQMLDQHDRATLLDLIRMLSKGESQRQISFQLRSTVDGGYQIFRATQPQAWDQLPLPEKPSESAYESALECLENSRLGNKTADQHLESLHLKARSGDWENVVSHGVYRRINEPTPTYYRKELPTDLVVALKFIAERAVAEILPIRRLQTLASYNVLDAYNARYMALIRSSRTMSFSDITYFVARWMKADNLQTENRSAFLSDHDLNAGSQPNLTTSLSQGKLALRLDGRIDHLLLDEFQDTSPEQWQILQPLAQSLTSQKIQELDDNLVPTRSRSFFCVGDAKQAIYAWRGGVAEIFENVGQSVSDLVHEQLQRSFRSSPQVMEVVNRVFQNLDQHDNFSDYQATAKKFAVDFPQHETARQQMPGYVVLQNGPFMDRTDAEASQKQSFEFTAAQIAELAKESRASIGVLFRTNDDVARMIAILRSLGVNASQDGGNPLTDSAAVQLLLSALHLADHPGDSVCQFHVQNSPLASYFPASVTSAPGTLSIWLREQVTLQGLGHTVESMAHQLAPHIAWWDQHRVEQLIRAAHEFESSVPVFRLRDFEQSVMQKRVALPTEAQVKVMTIHRSKGLEFDAVFLPELDVDFTKGVPHLVVRSHDPCQAPDGVLRYMNKSLQGYLPKSWQQAFERTGQQAVYEALCMLYVAMTRARNALYMTSRPSKSSNCDFNSLLLSILGDSNTRGEAESIVFELGNRDWFRELELDEQSEPKIETPKTIRHSIGLVRDPSLARERGLRAIRTSGKLHADDEPVSLSTAFSLQLALGTSYGTAMHILLEQVEWLEKFNWDTVGLQRRLISRLDPEELRQIQPQQIIDEFGEILRLSSIRQLLSKSRYTSTFFGACPDSVTVENERPINAVIDGQIVLGTVDRLVVFYVDDLPFAAEIIEFKTDEFDPQLSLLWVDEKVAQYRQQLDMHARAVSQQWHIPLERVVVQLALLGVNQVIRCDPAEPTLPNGHLRKTSTLVIESGL
ncbi:MAG: UvrD-helicase domain-containing protein [Planctomycetales bacterium]|nr:UvrD-helicase domain-containing protein [Planctomycetales bacterium]